jgi:hypothetical protein
VYGVCGEEDGGVMINSCQTCIKRDVRQRPCMSAVWHSEGTPAVCGFVHGSSCGWWRAGERVNRRQARQKSRSEQDKLESCRTATRCIVY